MKPTLLLRVAQDQDGAPGKGAFGAVSEIRSLWSLMSGFMGRLEKQIPPLRRSLFRVMAPVGMTKSLLFRLRR